MPVAHDAMACDLRNEADYEATLKVACDNDLRDLTSLAVLVEHLIARRCDAEATELARRALRHWPCAPGPHYLLGRALMRDRPREAAWHFRRHLELAGERRPEAISSLAKCLQDAGDIDGAYKLFQEAAEAAKDIAWPIIHLAAAKYRGRDLEASTALLDRVTAMPNLDASQVRRLTAAKSDVMAQMGKHEEAIMLLNDVVGSDWIGITARLSQGRLLARRCLHDQAFATMATAKQDLVALTGHTYDAEDAQFCAEATRAFFTPGNMALLPRADVRRDLAQPIFIVGFPRSGTTLMEQSLAAHQAIAAGGEMMHMDDLAKRAQGLLNSPLVYPDALSELWMADGVTAANTLRDWYLGRVVGDGIAGDGEPWFTDKRNYNEWHIGLITLAFPDAPIIRMVRHPLDAVLSVFSYPMDYGFCYAHSLEDAARHYALVADLTDDMLRRFPTRVLTVRYEDVVDRQEETMRRVLAHAGVPWDARCLAFTENKRYGHTESHAQVAEPLYRRACGRWQNYRTHLAQVTPILGPVIERLGYGI